LLALILTLLALAGAPTERTATVVKVYDGDTVTLSDGTKVRLRWVNTPERRPPEPYAEEARQLAERLVLGREVTLIIDGDDAIDGYGRLIAGVRTGRDDLSLRLLEQGLGHLFIIPPESADLTAMLEAQRSARAALRGIWSTDRYRGTLHITSFHANAHGDDTQNVNGEYLRVCNVTTGPVDLRDYVLKTDDGRRFVLPAMVLQPGHTVLLHSGHGENVDDDAAQKHIYLGQPQPIWNDHRAIATLLDPTGRVIDAAKHEVKGRP
jgi:endonuclease YncB( thermonuclease family)